MNDNKQKELHTAVEEYGRSDYLYRYLIETEEEKLVPLSEEMDFVNKYTDLMKVRFESSLKVETEIEEETAGKFVVPCSIQLLIENATKHNAVSEETPLRISVKVEDESVSVKNNLSPKITSIQSTGLGQTYIRQLYQDLSGKQIKIEKNETDYCVTLPLL